MAFMCAYAPPAAGEAADSGSVGIRLVAQSDAASGERDQLYLVDHVSPGTEIHREVEVQNASDHPQHIELYPAAASVHDGEFTADDGPGGNDLSEWASLEASSLDLEPGEIERVTVTIAVPKTAPEGERYAAILAEIAGPQTADSTVLQINRVGIRVYLSVGPGGEPPSDFALGDIEVLEAPPGSWPVLSAEVTNTGERALDVGGTATLERQEGTMTAGPFATRSPLTLAPGASGRAEIELDEPLPEGPWRAGVTLSSGDLERSGEAVVNLPETETASDGGTVGAVAALLIGLVVAAALAAMLLARKYLRRRS
ncbi:hypothetical protein O1R50_19870 [Glycomyces luteolus]|uniref:DUF916 domain-containing protein n=1 Tax=Glycomyces luteolus TaxID=2670330 RepID=A0A9X3PN54_9ACTN|nr:hypothetical protein [Glycomyces luteolus]MDA1361895.1 hypothetical protein [Glycomyces luteolus]